MRVLIVGAALILLALLLGGCSYKSVIVQLDQESGGHSIAGDVPDVVKSGADPMTGVLQPFNLKEFRKILRDLPPSVQSGLIQMLLGGAPDAPPLGVTAEPVLEVPNLPFDPNE